METAASEMESDLTQTSRPSNLWFCQPSYMHVIPDIDSIPTKLTISTYIALEGGKTRPIPTEVMKKAGLQSVLTLLKLSHLTWSGHVSIIATTNVCTLWRTSWGKRSQVATRNARKTPLKPRLRVSTFQLCPGYTRFRIEQRGVT